jgi:hypothetical protein
MKEGLCVEAILEFASQPGKQFFVAGQQAGLDQRRLHRQIAGRFCEAVLDRTHAVADLESDIPEEADELFEYAGERRIGRRLKKQQQINVGSGPQFAAPVTADGHQRE